MLNDFYRNKKVFVTGHTGFKGAWLTQWLLQLGAKVTGFSIDIPTEPSLFVDLGLSRQITDLRGDICSLEATKKAISDSAPDLVFHLAAQPLVPFSYQSPLLTFETNVTGTIHMIESLKNSSTVKAGIFITTDKCYENFESSHGYKETDRLGGFDPYSASKACAEIAFHSYCRSFPQIKPHLCTVRAGNVIGGGDWAKDRLIPDAIRSLQKKAQLVLRNPRAVRPWQHVLEPLHAYLVLGQKLFQSKDLHGESFNIGPSQVHQVHVENILESMKTQWPELSWRVEPSELKETQFLALDVTKAKQTLNWTSCLSMNETLNWTLDWYKTYLGHSDIKKITMEQIEAYEKKQS